VLGDEDTIPDGDVGGVGDKDTTPDNSILMTVEPSEETTRAMTLLIVTTTDRSLGL
jgi:hypothetical protein